MRSSDVNPKRFAVLSALMPGVPLGPVQVREAVGWSTAQVEFVRVQRTLERLGWITKATAGSTVHLTITPAGRQAWREAADLFMHLIELAQTPTAESPQQTADDPPPLLAIAPRPKERRLPTPAEAAALRAAATPEELLTWNVLRATLLPQEALFALQITDVDLQAGVIRIRREGKRPQKVKADAPLRASLRAAIGDRQAGPVLPRTNGNPRLPWIPSAWTKAWRRLRSRAGVPAGVLCRLRPTNTGRKPSTADDLQRAG